jgi:hypothetical protein
MAHGVFDLRSQNREAVNKCRKKRLGLPDGSISPKTECAVGRHEHFLQVFTILANAAALITQPRWRLSRVLGMLDRLEVKVLRPTGWR